MNSIRYFILSALLILSSLVAGYSQSKKNSGYHPAPGSPAAKKEEEAKEKKPEEAKEEGKEKAKEPEKEQEKKPLPLGYGVNLGNFYFTNYSFSFGLAPNIAYKLTESTAVGFMMKVDYYYEKYANGLNYSSFDYGPTVFGRIKPLWTVEGATPFLKGLFFQAEYERAFISRAKTDEFGNIILNNDHIETVRNGEDYVYLGVGASSGYPFSTFFSVHYNVLDKPTASRIPWSYRLGFTYNY